MPGWEEVLRPWLQGLINNSWLDPRDPRFKSDEEFLRAYNTAWAFANAAEQIIAYAQRLVEESEELTKKEKGEIPNKLKDAMS